MNVEIPQLDWSQPVEVQTRIGLRLLRKARPTENFWRVWRAFKDELKQQGLSVNKRDDGAYEVLFWAPVGEGRLEQIERAIGESAALDADVDVPLPPGMALFPFQRAGVKFALDRKRVLIADEMGLGKTVQAIGVINADESIRRVLIVCPANLKANWARELRRWLVRPLSVGIADAGHWPGRDIVVVNYDVVHKHRPRLITDWDMVVLDEAQRCKNPDARRTRTLLGYKTKTELWPGVRGRYMLALTGTPIENRPIEIQPILAWLQPNERLWNRYRFAHRYCAAHHNGWGWDFNGASNLGELRRELRSKVMIRRSKAQVLTELPSKMRQVVELDSDEGDVAVALRDEAEALQRVRAAVEAAEVEVELAKTAADDEAFKAAAQQLRDARAYAFGEVARVRHATALAKAPAAIEYIKDVIESVGVKVIVFAHHLDVIGLLAAAFPSAVVVTGETPRREVQPAVDRFQNDPAFGPFIGSIRATGEGLTLTAASHVIFVEQDWTPGRMLQCEDRAHRIGQASTVTCHYLVANGSIDARIMHVMAGKMDVIAQSLDGERRADGSPAIDQVVAVLFPDLTGVEPAKRNEYRDEAAAITDGQIAAIHKALIQLDGCGGIPNKIEAGIIRRLAGEPSLTPAQAALGRRLCLKHRDKIAPETLKGIHDEDRD